MRIVAHMRLRRFGFIELEDAVDRQAQSPRGHRVHEIGAHVLDLGAQLLHRARAMGDADIGDALVGVEVEVEVAAPAAEPPELAVGAHHTGAFLFWLAAAPRANSVMGWAALPSVAFSTASDQS